MPVDRKKLNKKVKNNFFCYFLKKNIYTYISRTNLVVGNIFISFNNLLDSVRHGLDQFRKVRQVVHPEDTQLSNHVLQLLQLVGWAYLSCTFIQDHTFLIGLRSGLLPGHLMSWMYDSGTSAKKTHKFKCKPNKKISS